MFTDTDDTIRSDPADTIWSSQQYDRIHPTITIQSSRWYNMIQRLLWSERPIQDPYSVTSLPQHTYFIPHSLLIPPNLIFHPPHRPLPSEIFSLSLLLHLLLPSLLRIYIAPSPRPIFGLSNCKSHRAIFWSNPWVLDGYTSATLLLLFPRLIVHFELLMLIILFSNCIPWL